MAHETAAPTVGGLISDGVALSEALLAGDFPEGRFRARLIVTNSGALGLSDVQAKAGEVVRLLGGPSCPPNTGYAMAVLQLSLVLDRTLSRI
jgi:hypothetical protein